MDWQALDRPTRAGFVATVIAVLGFVVPPISIAAAVAAVGFSGFALVRARRAGATNRVALGCLVGCGALIIVVVVGNAVYGAAS